MLTAELVVDGLVPREPVVSPDGRSVAYVVAPIGLAGEHPSDQLWVTAVDGSPRRLDAPSGALSHLRWSSGAVCFLSDRGEAQLYRGATALTDWRGGIDSYQLLADPDVVAIVAADEPTEREVRRLRDRDDAEVRGRARPARLRLLDLRTGRIRTVTSLGDRHVVEVVQRPDGGPLAVLTWSTPEIDPGLVEPALHLVDPETLAVQDIGSTPADAAAPVWWLADEWHLSYLALTPPGLQAGTAVFDVVGSRHRNLTAGSAACPIELVQVDRGTPLVLVADGLDTTICDIDLVEVARVRGQVTQLSASRDGDVVAAVVSTAGEPGDVHAGPVDGLVRLTDTRPELRGIRWGEQQRLSYRASDGLALDGLLILPPARARADGPFPTVTLVHGGPYDRYADGFLLHWASWGQWLAHAGYAVFLPNPRGGRGHGHEFAASVTGAVGQAEWTDILTGIDLLVADGVADPDRLGIGGWSHGGFMAAWAVGHTDRFAAAVMGAGISDWGMQAGSGEWGVFETALGGSVGWEGVGPHPHDRLSPISYASAVRTPVLILHGADDTNVPLSQAEYFHRALRRFGVEHEFVVYPRENHSFRERNHQIDVLHRTRAWFDRWLRPPD
jgi:dipeptidyl aminopeptidase/acylaminoacyl peptidase